MDEKQLGSLDGGTTDAADDGGTVYHDLASPEFWAVFDTTAAKGKNFGSAAFDGRYLYLVPEAGGVVARYDTQADFKDANSWSTFDTTAVNPGAAGFYGAVFDGRYLYLVANCNALPCSLSTGQDGIVARYDTIAAFGATASWSTFDTTTLNANAKGYAGAVFDERYVYFVPSQGLVTRYDTQSSFTDPASWSIFDTATKTDAKVFMGGVFDGRFVYLAPISNGSGVLEGLVPRYDTQASFTDPTSWSIFDASSVTNAAKGFFSEAFDGRYIYMATGPYGLPTVAVRFDTTSPFLSADSWSFFDTSAVNAELFLSATFDGRYVYFGETVRVARYDTYADFTTTDAWSSFDTSSLSGTMKGCWELVFDGRYVYCVADSMVARFDAKTPSSMPKLPGFYGTFR